MKRSVIKNLLLLLFPILVFGQTSFEKANQAYKDEEYQLAIDGYEEILKSGKHSAELYYNLGNAYYKLNRVAPSIYNYEKALLLQPNNADVKNNLKFVQNMMIDSIKEVPKTGFTKWLQNFTSVFHYNTWAKITVGFSFLILLSFIGYYFTSRIAIKRIFFGLGILFLVGLMLSGVISSFEKNQTKDYNPAIVFSESVSVKTEPNPASTNVILIHEGTKVYIMDDLDDYYKVELPDRTQGWIVKTSVEML